MKRLTRKQKILRNLILLPLLVLLLWGALGFSPLTAAAMCRHMSSQFLLPPMEPIYVGRAMDPYSRDGEFFKRRYTFVIAKTGEEYMDFLYERSTLLTSRISPYRYFLTPQKDSLCAVWKENVYWAGPFQDAASATLTASFRRDFAKDLAETWEAWEAARKAGEDVSPERPDEPEGPGETVTFTVQGRRLGDEIFAFDYTEGGDPDKLWWYRADEIGEPASLYEAVAAWYWLEHDGGAFSLLHTDIALTLTLYDGQGNLLDTRESALDTYEFNDPMSPRY